MLLSSPFPCNNTEGMSRWFSVSPYPPLFFLLILATTTISFNITSILNEYPDFSLFNHHLTQTQLAKEINGRETITVLVVENGNMFPITSLPVDVIKMILSVHVLLDYYDVSKLQTLPNGTALVTTLLQTTGEFIGQQGFLNVTDLSTGGVAIGSAVPDSIIGSNLVKSIASQPYDISVLQISNVIVPPGINKNAPPSPDPVVPSPPVVPFPFVPSPVVPTPAVPTPAVPIPVVLPPPPPDFPVLLPPPPPPDFPVLLPPPPPNDTPDPDSPPSVFPPSDDSSAESTKCKIAVMLLHAAFSFAFVLIFLPVGFT